MTDSALAVFSASGWTNREYYGDANILFEHDMYVCFVLFCFVLFCFVLFCFVLFCFVLFCFVFTLFLISITGIIYIWTGLYVIYFSQL